MTDYGRDLDIGKPLDKGDDTQFAPEVQVTHRNQEEVVDAIERHGGVFLYHKAPVSIGATTTVALAANVDRKYAIFINDSNETIYLMVGDPAVLNDGIRLNASGGSWEMSKAFGNLDIGQVNAICTSGSKVLLVAEGV